MASVQFSPQQIAVVIEYQHVRVYRGITGQLSLASLRGRLIEYQLRLG